MKTIIEILGVIALFLLVAIICALPTMWLWNWLMPDIFGLTELSFWQAFGINLLTGTLFRVQPNK